MKDARVTTIITTVVAIIVVFATFQSFYHRWCDRAHSYNNGRHSHYSQNEHRELLAQHSRQQQEFRTNPHPQRRPRQGHPDVWDLSSTPRANGALVMLVRNTDIHNARSTLRQIEDRFNHRYHYPYVFLNNVPFTQEFEEWIRPMSKANMTFATIPKEHWSYPEWISVERAAETREKMKNVVYGASESYRHMCRYQSGFFFKHETLQPFDYCWRIEPNAEVLCDIDFDPFLYVQENKKKYGFTITMVENPETMPTLWKTVKDFMEQEPHHIAPDPLLPLVSFGHQKKHYNGCHFWTNFEIADLRWFRSAAYEAFFVHLDRAGGFFYERWGDAPVHSIAAALLLNKDEIHYFREIGYRLPPYLNCPLDPDIQLKGHCNPQDNLNSKSMNGFVGCTRHFLKLTGAKDILSDDMDEVGSGTQDFVCMGGLEAQKSDEVHKQQQRQQQAGNIQLASSNHFMLDWRVDSFLKICLWCPCTSIRRNTVNEIFFFLQRWTRKCCFFISFFIEQTHSAHTHPHAMTRLYPRATLKKIIRAHEPEMKLSKTADIKRVVAEAARQAQLTRDSIIQRRHVSRATQITLRHFRG